MADRGVYLNANRGRQLLRFDGMRYLGNITPTDVDALIEVRNKVLVLFEAKMQGKEVPYGQKIALERLVKDAKKAGKHAIAIVVDHDVQDPDEDVYLHDLGVREVYTSEDLAWKPPNWKITANDAAAHYIGRFFKLT